MLLTPPKAWIPSYMTTFQSSPVKIWRWDRSNKQDFNDVIIYNCSFCIVSTKWVNSSKNKLNSKINLKLPLSNFERQKILINYSILCKFRKVREEKKYLTQLLMFKSKFLVEYFFSCELNSFFYYFKMMNKKVVKNFVKLKEDCYSKIENSKNHQKQYVIVGKINHAQNQML